jgi:hypothetical protein
MSGTANLVRVKDAPELRGFTEAEALASLRGKVRFKRVNGDLCVDASELGKAMSAGVVRIDANSTDDRTADAAAFLGIALDGSTSSENSTDAKPEPITDPLAPVTDPQVEARTEAMARELGIDLKPTPSSTSSDDDRPKVRQAGAVTVRADDNEGYRLGRPRRWGQT